MTPSPEALTVTLVIAGEEEDSLYTPQLFHPSEARAVMCVRRGAAEEL